MAINILEQLTREFSGDMVGKIGRALGVGAPVVQEAMPSALSALVGAVTSKGSSSSGASQLLDLVQSGGFGEKTLSGMAASLSGGDGTKNLMEQGKSLVSSILGDKAGGVGAWLSSQSGLSKDNSMSLLALLAPFVMGMIGRQVKDDNLNAGGVMGLLSNQAGYLQRAAPVGLAGMLGLSSFSSLGAGGAAATSGGLPAILWVVAGIVLVVALFFMQRQCTMKQVKVPEVQIPAAAVKIDPILGAFGDVTLPNGVKINIPELGIERKLLAFIQDAGKPVDNSTWFTFDRLQFETGSAMLKPSSLEQLTNIAEILKAFPQVAIKLGGYTDNVGSQQANLKLSGDRASNTMQELVKLGIDSTRLEAQGYGDQHPVADNATPEGRQKNRRIDVRVTKK